MNKELTIGDFITFQRGYDLPKSKANSSGKYKVITSNGVMTMHDSFKSGPSIVIGRSGTVGKPQLINEDFWPHNTTLFVKDLKGNDIYYIYYLLMNLNIDKIKSGSNIPTLNRNHLHPLKVNGTLDVNEQRHVVKILKNIDELINKNNSIFNQTTNIINTMFNYHFFQFDSFSEESLVYNDQLKIKIPSSWKVENLKKNTLCKPIKSGIIKFNDEKIYLPTSCINGDSIKLGDKITYEKRESRANMQPIPNSVWFAKMKKSIKHLTITEDSNYIIDNIILSTGFCGIETDKKYLPYISCYLNSAFFENYKDKIAHGATQEAINDNDLKFIPLLVPDEQSLSNFSKLTYDIFTLRNSIIEENLKLEKVRDFLLPLLMNGKIKVAD